MQTKILYMKLDPLGATIICKNQIAKEEVDGIIIPESAKKQEEVAVIESVGPDVKSEKLRSGTVIVLPVYASRKHELDGETYHILDEDDIKVVIVSDDQHGGKKNRRR